MNFTVFICKLKKHFGVPKKCVFELKNHFGVPKNALTGSAPSDRGSVLRASRGVENGKWGGTVPYEWGVVWAIGIPRNRFPRAPERFWSSQAPLKSDSARAPACCWPSQAPFESDSARAPECLRRHKHPSRAIPLGRQSVLGMSPWRARGLQNVGHQSNWASWGGAGESGSKESVRLRMVGSLKNRWFSL